MSTTANISALFKPVKFGPYTVRNRVFMSPMTRNRSVPTNVPNDLNVEYYRQRARSAGLIITEGVLVSQQGTEWPHAPGLWSREQVDGWKKVIDAVHAEGGLIYAQLWHLGRVSHPEAPEQIAAGVPVYGPSAIAAHGGKFRHIPGKPDASYVTPTAIDDPKKLIALFKQAAINAKEAGFDGVEIHAAGGYLHTQFLETGSNQRTDAYGGSLANRTRFTLETLKEVIDIWGPERVGIRLSPAGGFNDSGMPLDAAIETYSYLITEIDKLGIGYITLMRYTDAFDPVKRGTPHDVIATYGPLIKNPKTSLVPTVGFTPEEGAQFVEKGIVAAIAYGRDWIVHPDFAQRIQDGKPLDGLQRLDMMGFYGHYPPYPHSEDLFKGEKLAQLKEDLKKGYSDYPDTDVQVADAPGVPIKFQ